MRSEEEIRAEIERLDIELDRDLNSPNWEAKNGRMWALKWVLEEE